ncbi:keratin, type I cytoskeletal 10-like [Ooceraea biroi]|uniref:keratin, type I cytoskeletal 10-like n=1 Tax=Ooceraea biroi TaxID=2015173 RepID=UPI000F08C43B|nr:keratin, type I cytoskeletal 10-like [Ooceraea biroi]
MSFTNKSQLRKHGQFRRIKPTGRPAHIDTNPILQMVRDDPTISTRTIARNINVSQKTVCRALKSAHFHPYKVILTQELRINDESRILSYGAGTYPGGAEVAGTYAGAADADVAGTYAGAAGTAGTYPDGAEVAGTYAGAAGATGTYAGAAGAAGTYPGGADVAGTYAGTAGAAGTYTGGADAAGT